MYYIKFYPGCNRTNILPGQSLKVTGAALVGPVYQGMALGCLLQVLDHICSVDAFWN